MSAVENREDDERDREQGNRGGPRDRDCEDSERGADEGGSMGIPEPPYDDRNETGADEPTDCAGESTRPKTASPARTRSAISGKRVSRVP